MTAPSIVFLGAGSVVFTRELVGDLLGFAELADARIVLHDIDPERLEVAEAITRSTAAEFDVRPEVVTHADRRAALAGADFVINTIQVGMHAATVTDFEVPARYGLRQTIADTIGIGGIFRGLRTFPVLASIAADILAICPDAWLLNYTNPMAMNIAYLHRVAPDLNVLGLCHSVYWTVRDLCALLEVDFDGVTWHSAGVNHQAWLLRWQREGRSLYPLLDARIDADPDLRRRVRVDMYRRLGYYPTETSEHSSEYVPWYLRHDGEIRRLRIPVGDYLDVSAANLAEYERVKQVVAAGERLPVDTDAVEYAPQVIHAMLTDTAQTISANVINSGLITNLPAEAAVEVPTMIDGAGPRPAAVGALPAQCAALNRNFLAPGLLAVEAAVTGDPRLVRHAAMLDPNTAATLTVDQIWSLCDDLTAAHGALIPASLRAPVRL